ncbi:MAG TPA: hypothetical protein VMF11_07010 [Candidatus Baltobacteraceae bacterium]|nr:hypothetical protein [Candidatus Baltobacteraceae bacterium]
MPAVIASPPADAYLIFQRTRSAVSAARYPQRIEYTIAVRGDDGSTPRTNHYAASYGGRAGILVSSISQEEAAHPTAPRGINVSIHFFLSGGNGSGTSDTSIAVGRPEPSADLLGVPILSPTYTFGLRFPERAGQTPVAGPAPSLPTIAVVSTEKRNYAVSLLGTDVIGGVDTCHLALTPLREPKVNRLRELWVGENDYLPRKALVAGNFTIAPLADVPWTIDFTLYGGAPLISNESADQPLYLPHRRVVTNATISFDDVRESYDFIDEPLLTPAVTGTTLIEPPDR